VERDAPVAVVVVIEIGAVRGASTPARIAHPDATLVGVALSIDTTLALRGIAALDQLVSAIVRANASDESGALEWKSNLDLSTKAGCFEVARQVLAMANRDPAVAAIEFEGCGYVVVGAEPGNVAGIASVDPADYVEIINQYVGGAKGPRWTPTWLTLDAKHVLVVTVEAPSLGDAIWTLRKESPSASATVKAFLRGTVFHREPGKTEQATDDHIEMLTRRAADNARVKPDVTVELDGDIPLSWFNASSLHGSIRQWVTGHVALVVDAAHEVERHRNPPPEPPGQAIQSPKTNLNFGVLSADSAVVRSALQAMEEIARNVRASNPAAQVLKSVPALGGYANEDRRTLDQFLNEVDSWSDELLSRATDGFLGFLISQGFGAVQIRVANLSERFLTGVQVKLHFDWEYGRAYDEELEFVPLTKPPRPLGTPPVRPEVSSLWRRPDLFGISAIDSRRFSHDVGRRVWVEHGAIVFNVGEVRPRGIDRSDDDIWIVLEARPSSGTLDGTWELTAHGLHAIVAGRISVPVAELPVDARDVCESAFSDPDS